MARRSRWIKSNSLALAALVVALFGGIPGLISVFDYFWKVSIRIGFDEQNSVAAAIDSKKDHLNNKIAVLLYRITVTGAGSQISYMKDMSLELRIGRRWLKGQRFSPRQDVVQSGPDGPIKAVRLRHRINGKILALANWENFIPGGDKGLRYGQPANLSYAAVFDIQGWDFEKADRLKIAVIDYLGNEYKETVRVTPMMKGTAVSHFLIHDKDTP